MKSTYTNRIRFILLMGMIPLLLSGNDSTDFQITWKGFIKNDFMMDTRKNLEAVSGLFLFYPLQPSLDSEGNDLNQKINASMLSLSSRVGMHLSGVRFLNARASGLVEFDFTNVGTIAGVRFRHAYSRLDWENSSVLFGLYWHPLFTTEVFPTVMSLNTGAPFQVFNRSPQIRYIHRFQSLTLTATALYQGDYMSSGPAGSSSMYMRNAVLPNLNLKLSYQTAHSVIGMAGDYKVLQPRTSVQYPISPGVTGTRKTDETISSWAFTAFYKYSNNKLVFKAKGLYGQNLTEHLLTGGYAVSSLEAGTSREEYTPYNHLFAWANVLYGQKIQAGLFTGYFKNLGTSDPVVGDIYARGENIDHAWRVTPFLAYNEKKVSLSAELEVTAAAYGDIDKPNNARILNPKEVINTRLTLTMMYYF